MVVGVFRGVDSDELVAFDEFGLGGDGDVCEVEYFAEKWFASCPLDHFFLGEEQKAAGEGDQEDQFEQVDPGSVENDLHEGRLWAHCLILVLHRLFLRRVQDLIAALAWTETFFSGGLLKGRLTSEGLMFATDDTQALGWASDDVRSGLRAEE